VSSHVISIYFFILFHFILFIFSPLYIIFPTTDLMHNNSCNYSVRLVLTILSIFVFLAYLSLIYFFAI